MTESLPAPLVRPEVDLQDFPGMLLDVRRLRDSDLVSDFAPEACFAAVLLWCAAWHQIPAASIPDNEQWIAKHAGYVSRGRIDPGWSKVRDGALRGFVKCSDGRLYHTVVAEKAREAWRSKLEQRWRSECARIKKHNQRHGTSLTCPEFDEWLSLGCPQGHTTLVPGTASIVPRDTSQLSPGQPTQSGGTAPHCPQSAPRETPSKRREEKGREVEGKELQKREVDVPPPPLREEATGHGNGANGNGAVENVENSTARSNSGQEWSDEAWVAATALTLGIERRPNEPFADWKDRVYSAVQMKRVKSAAHGRERSIAINTARST